MSEEHGIVRALREMNQRAAKIHANMKSSRATDGRSWDAYFVVFFIALGTVGLEFLLEYFGFTLGIVGFAIVAGCVGVGWLLIIGAYGKLFARLLRRNKE